MIRRSTTARLVLFGCAAALGALSVTVFRPQIWAPNATPEMEDLADILSVPRAPLQLHLYSGAVDPATGKLLDPREQALDSVDAPANPIALLKRSEKRRDGSLIVVRYRQDGRTPHASDEFYPERAGEEFYRLHTSQELSDDGKNVVHQDTYNIAGTSELALRSLADGRRQTTKFYDDGSTVREQVITPATSEDVLQKDLFSTLAKGNRLAWQMLLNPDKSKTTNEFGDDGLLVKTTTTGPSESIEGTRIKGFYPGTTKERMESSTDSYKTNAQFYRRNGSLLMTQALSQSLLDVSYYGQDGRTVIYTQSFAYSWVTEEGKSVQRYRLNRLTLHLAGDEVKEFVFDASSKDPKLMYVKRSNFVLDGVHYLSGEYHYRQSGTDNEIGTLDKTKLERADDEIGEGAKITEHSWTENIRPNLAGAEDKMGLPDLSDKLPVPQPSYDCDS